MKKLKGYEIRKMWIDFFASKGHYEEPSASLVPQDDPTLLWINAGVAALKKYFDGREKPTHKRIVNSQKSIRTNDIENVGRTSRHHTFFEMLGNFSIGDYFRTEAITWGYELLTSEKWFDIPPEKLYITYHPLDEESRDLWISLGMSPDHLIANNDNFWEIGEGPCGPDTEIFFDRGEKYDPQHLGEELIRKDLDNDRYIEMWNIVFSQFNSDPALKRSEYKELPQKNIDTGASLERFACVFQDVDSNYETDLLFPIILAIEKIATVKYSKNTQMAFRVIADHVRACTFALSDGATFSNEGRGYVLKRLIRRAYRYGKKIGIEGLFLYTLVDEVEEIMKDYYPYLLTKKEKVKKMIYFEEEKFQKTLKSGEQLLSDIIEKLEGKILSGTDAFKLSDTYGFPFELTVEIAQEHGISVDEKEFKEQLKLQKERARSARDNFESLNKQAKDLLDFEKKSEFTYDCSLIEAKVIGIFKDGVKVDSLSDEGEVMFDKTNFYALSGGQIYDIGEIENDSTAFDVEKVIKAPNGQHLHFVKVKYGEIKVGDKLKLSVDNARRTSITYNHTAAHLLQKALQEVLGEDVHQAGSEVTPSRLRFDFTFSRKLTNEEVSKVEDRVNQIINQGMNVSKKIYTLAEAKKLGAMALFDEKYGDFVRVVDVEGFSREFCAGCHVDSTKEIGCFAIGLEESIASGVRRIEAYTAMNAYKLLKEKADLLLLCSEKAKVGSVKELPLKLEAYKNEIENCHNENKLLAQKVVSYIATSLKNKITTIDNLNILIDEVYDLSHEQFSELMTSLRNESNGIVFLLNKSAGKIEVGCAVGKDGISKNFKAGNLIKEFSSYVGGSGGGKPDLAFGAMKDEGKIAVGKEFLSNLIKNNG